ncbi:Protein of unknown function [Gryllus bimaculatus]|nr:Protein of unknown function [Gryllus bimaculatus]
MVEWFGWLVWLGGAVGGGLGARRSGAWRVAAGLPDAHDYLHAQPAQRDPEAPKRTQVPRSTPDHSSTLPPISDHPSTLPPSTSDHPSTPVPFTTDHPNSAGADPWDAAEADAEAEAAAGAAGADADDEDDDPVVERQSSPAQWLSRCARQEHRDLSLHRHSESPLPLETRCLLR